MKCHISNSVFIGNIDPFLLGFSMDNEHELEITTHDAWMSAHPVVLAMIAAKGLTVAKGNVHVDSLRASSARYFERMKLFSILGVETGIDQVEADPSGRFVPLTQIRNADEQTRFITEVMPLLHLQSHQAEAIRYVLSELIRNVLEHARSPQGAVVAAQYHKKSNLIRIGIADVGVGVKSSINQSHRAWNDLEALHLALTPGVTGTTPREGGTTENAGAGLFFIKSIASSSRNFFMLYSGNALYKLLKRPISSALRLHADPIKDRHSERQDVPYWQGTVVGIDLSLDDTVEFNSLLDHIRTTYSNAVRERKQIKRKQPRFR